MWFYRVRFKLRAHGNVFERFHLCFHAKTDANTNNLLQTLELIQYIENIFPWSVYTGRQNDKRDEKVFENARKRRPCVHSLRNTLRAVLHFCLMARWWKGHQRVGRLCTSLFCDCEETSAAGMKLKTEVSVVCSVLPTLLEEVILGFNPRKHSKTPLSYQVLTQTKFGSSLCVSRTMGHKSNNNYSPSAAVTSYIYIFFTLQV